MPKTSPWKFAGRLLLFWAPVLLIFGFFELLFWVAGEIRPVSSVLAYQKAHPHALFLRGKFDQQISHYKFLGLTRARPRILALGSSRVMKFRSEMFGEGRRNFYNGTGLITQIEDLDDYVELFRGNFPKVIILGIDPWILNDQRHVSHRLATELGADAALDWKAHLAVFRHLKGRDIHRLWEAAGNHTPDRIGAAATLNNEGYRWDGSFATHLPTQATDWRFKDRESPPIPERIRNAEKGFESTPHASAFRLRELRRALQRLKSGGATVIGFLPPVSSESYHLLSTLPAHQQFWSEYKTETANLFKELDMPFTDATDLAPLGLDDRYMTDGIHAEETFHLYLLRQMLKDSRVQEALPHTGIAVNTALADPATNFYYPRFSE
ncbi:MAG: hypothetical protein JWM99_3901 [Verrucomicrobiales bacterium]|nr:hypothetical protein [Verrucomicrobiales bacterium]